MIIIAVTLSICIFCFFDFLLDYLEPSLVSLTCKSMLNLLVTTSRTLRLWLRLK